MKAVKIPIYFYDLIHTNVWSQNKRDNLIAIFENEDPGHYEKLYFCGFLLNVLKLSLDDVMDIILNQSAWNKKNPHMTFLQVRSVMKSISHFSVSDDFLNRFRLSDNEITEKTNITKTVKKWTNTEIKPKKTLADFEPKSCQIGSTHVTCYFKKCEQCSLIHSHNPTGKTRTGGI